MTQLTTAGGDGALAELPSVGTDLAESVLDSIESDVALAVHRRALRDAQARLRAIQGDFKRLVEEAAGASDADRALGRLYVEGCRDELRRCYLTVNRKVAVSADGRKRLEELVDGLLRQTLDKLAGPDEGKAPLAEKTGKPSRSKS
jgi:hypothetical protein